jgi:hypothetical protein
MVLASWMYDKNVVFDGGFLDVLHGLHEKNVPI